MMNQLQSIASYSEELGELSENFRAWLAYGLKISLLTLEYAESINFSEEEIDLVSSRLSVIEDAKRKYNMTSKRLSHTKKSSIVS